LLTTTILSSLLLSVAATIVLASLLLLRLLLIAAIATSIPLQPFQLLLHLKQPLRPCAQSFASIVA
jgi:hypothetical protein